jgi:hypothetical protein
MRPKATSMIKFGYIFLVINLLLAGVFWSKGDRGHTVMFLSGCCIWIFGILTWYKAARQEEEDGK